jgi:aldose 1-epimerase
MTPDTEFRFIVLEEKFGAYSAFKLSDSKTGEYASVIPHLGGSINELVLNHKGKLIPVIDGYSSSEDADKNLGSSFKGSNLFPYPNRIADAKFIFEGDELHLPMNFPQEKNAIHGLIYNQEFEVIDQENGEIGCKLILRYLPKEQVKGYPFNYLLEITFRLTAENGFECSTKISNLNDQKIPLGHGWHPYFISGNVVVNDLLLEFPADKILEVDKRGIPTGKTENYSKFNQLHKIEKTELDSCFLLEASDQPAEILIINKALDFGYLIWQERGINKYNYLQIYTPPTRKSIAIEPMTCAPNAFNNEKGLIVLAPLERISISWGVKHLK